MSACSLVTEGQLQIRNHVRHSKRTANGDGYLAALHGLAMNSGLLFIARPPGVLL